MSCSNPIRWATVWRTARNLAVVVLVASAVGCQPEPEDDRSENSRWWYMELEPAEGEMAFRTALLMAWEGWNGAESQATSLTVFSDLYENGGLLVRIAMTGQASRPRCPMRGCYLYARRNGGTWQVLRAVPADESRDYLDLLNPWSLQSLLEGADELEIEVPIQSKGSCIYTLPVAGYRYDLHRPAGAASLNGDGSARENVSLTDEDNEQLDGPPSEGTTWPRCTEGIR